MNTWGDPQGSTLLFLHANSYSARLYHSFLEPLFDSYQVLAPDLPGHGESRWNGRIQAWADIATFYSDHFTRNPPKTPMVGMGHSIGGIVMMQLAIKHPQWFSRIILLDPVMLPKRILAAMRVLRLLSLSHLIPLVNAANHRKVQFPSRQVALEHYSKKQVFSRWEPQFLEAYVESCLHETESGILQLSCAPHLESSIYQSIPSNVWSLPARLKTPSLFLIGRYSDTVNRKGMQRIQRLVGNDVVKRIDGGHLFPFEKPDESMELIKDFLAV